jgi:hypothetical protein
MRVAAEGLRHDLLELGFYFVDSLARSKASAIADAEHVRIDGERLLAECGVEDHIGGLAAHPGKRLKLLATAGHFAAEITQQRLGERNDVFRLGVEQADALDVIANRVLAERDHLFGGFGALEQLARGDVDAHVGSLRREHDGDEKRVRTAIFEFGGGRGVRLREPTEEFENVVALHRWPITSCME